jgi:hypothetical protein
MANGRDGVKPAALAIMSPAFAGAVPASRTGRLLLRRIEGNFRRSWQACHRGGASILLRLVFVIIGFVSPAKRPLSSFPASPKNLVRFSPRISVRPRKAHDVFAVFLLIFITQLY